VQKKLIPLFYYSLSPAHFVAGQRRDGGGFTNLFAGASLKSRLFRRTESTLPLERVEFPASFGAGPPAGAEARPAPRPPPASSPWRISWFCSITPAGRTHQ